jgi:hypothetical protein
MGIFSNFSPTNLAHKARDWASAFAKNDAKDPVSHASQGKVQDTAQKGYSTVDSIAPAQPDMIATKMDATSKSFEIEIKKDNRNFEKLLSLVHDIVMLVMRKAVKTDQEYLTEVADQIKVQSMAIKKTYDSKLNVTITVISAGIGLFGGAAGLSQFLPASIISQQTAVYLSQNAQAIGNAGTSLSGLGSLVNLNNEGKRTYLQLELKRIEGKEEDRKGAKHSNKELIKTANAAQKELNQMRHEAAKAAAAA